MGTNFLFPKGKEDGQKDQIAMGLRLRSGRTKVILVFGRVWRVLPHHHRHVTSETFPE